MPAVHYRMQENMLKIVAICGVLVCVVLDITAQTMLGAGKWSILSVSRCENDGDMPWRLEARRRRLNRTHEALSADLKLGADLDDSYAIRIDVCKKVDGGCKPYMTMADDSLPHFLKKHAEENVRLALSSAGIDPPDFPIPAGEHHIENYIVDTDSLPKDGVYGEFGVSCFIMKDGKDMACVAGTVRYEPVDGPPQFG